MTLKKVGKKIVDIFLIGFWSVVGIVLGWISLKFLLYLVMIAWFFVNMIFGLGTKEHYLYDFQIESMKDSHTYVVSRYNGDSELRYYFVREIDGKLITGNTNASDSAIIEDGESRVEVFTEVPKNGGDAYIKLAEMATFGEDKTIFLPKEYIYHIPKDSVEMNEFEIDLE